MKVKEIAESINDGAFKAHRIYELSDSQTCEVTGLLLEMYVNKYYHYYDFLLKSWKNRFATDELYITYKRKYISICFKIRA